MASASLEHLSTQSTPCGVQPGDHNLLPLCRMVAVYQHSCTYKVTRQLLRRSQMQQAVAFDVWLQYTQHRRNLQVHMQLMVTQAAHRTLSGAFQGWAQFAAASAGDSI